MMAEQVSYRLSVGQWSTRIGGGSQSEQRARFTLFGWTLIRHASPSCAVTAISIGVHSAATRSCLVASPCFPLPIAARLLCAGSEAVALASIAPRADKNLRIAASTQKHSARRFIDTRGSACPTRRIPALCARQFQLVSPQHWHFLRLAPAYHGGRRRVQRCQSDARVPGIILIACRTGSAATIAPRSASLWICGQGKGLAHKSTGATAIAESNV